MKYLFFGLLVVGSSASYSVNRGSQTLVGPAARESKVDSEQDAALALLFDVFSHSSRRPRYQPISRPSNDIMDGKQKEKKKEDGCSRKVHLDLKSPRK